MRVFRRILGGWKLKLALLEALLLVFSPIISSISSPFSLSIARADEIAWDGEAGDGLWSNPVNWVEDQLPGLEDIAIFSSELPAPAIVDIDAEIGGIELTADFVGQLELAPGVNLEVGNNGFRQSGGRFKGADGSMAVAGNVRLNSGEFNAPSTTLELGGNLSVFAPDLFKHNAGSVELTGRDQVLFGDIVFNNFSKVTLISDRLTLTAGRNITVNGDLVLSGEPAVGEEDFVTNHLQLVSSKTDQPALVEVEGTALIQNVSVQNILNIGLSDLDCLDCAVSGTTTGWNEYKSESEDEVVSGEDEKDEEVDPVVIESNSETNVVQVDDIEESTERTEASFLANETPTFTVDLGADDEEVISPVDPVDGTDNDLADTDLEEEVAKEVDVEIEAEIAEQEEEEGIFDELYQQQLEDELKEKRLEDELDINNDEQEQEVPQAVSKKGDEDPESISPPVSAKQLTPQTAGLNTKSALKYLKEALPNEPIFTGRNARVEDEVNLAEPGNQEQQTFWSRTKVFFQNLSDKFWGIFVKPVEASVLEDLEEAFAESEQEALSENSFVEADGLDVQVLDYLGNSFPNAVVTVLSDGEKLLVEVRQPETSFRPGQYTIVVNDQALEFSWGVLATNTPQTSYQVKDEVPVFLGVLDNRGKTICDANVDATLYQVDEAGLTKLDTLPVQKSEECGPRSVTDVPDYSTTFSPQREGEYVVLFKAKYTFDSASAKATTRFVKQKINVLENTDFIVTRSSATRIYPLKKYRVDVEVRASRDFAGSIKEAVPASFDISEISAGGVLIEAEAGGVGGPSDEIFEEIDSEQADEEPEEVVVNEEEDEEGSELDTGDEELEVLDQEPVASDADEDFVLGDEEKGVQSTLSVSPTPSISPTPSATPELTPEPSPELSPEPTLESSVSLSVSPIPVVEETVTADAVEGENVRANSSYIEWPKVEVKAGESVTLSYAYDAPNISPQFYLLGPLTLHSQGDPVDWIEPRQWQIASDATFNDAASGPWDDGATWGNNSPGTVGIDFPGSSDSATIDSHTVTIYGFENVDDVTLDSGGTLVSDNDIFDNGLVGYWKLDESTDNTCSGGEDACDSSGNGNHATDSGGSSITSSAASVDFSNPYSRDFTGSNYLDAGSDSSLNISGALSLSVWVYADSAVLGDRGIIDNEALNYAITYHSSGYIYFYINNGGNNANAPMSTGSWHHLGATWDGTTGTNGMKLYIDGVLSGQKTSGYSTTGADGPLYIGKRVAGNHFDGRIDDVRVYNRELSADEVSALAFGNGGENMVLEVGGSWANTGGTFTEGSSAILFNSTSDETITANSDDFNDVIINDGLVGYWKLDEGSDDTCVGGEDACDSSGYGNHGTGTGWDSDEWSSSVGNTNFTNPYSVSLDGSNDYIDVGDLSVPSSNEATIAFWTYFENGETANQQPFFALDFDYSGDDGALLKFDGTNGWQVLLGNVSSGSDGVSDPSEETWVHVVGTIDFSSGDVEIFVNGSSIKTATVNSTIGSSANNTFIGKEGTNYAGVKIDDVRYYNRILSDIEIGALAAGNQPATENTTASEFSLSGALDVDGDLILNSGELDADANITVAGAWENNGGIFTPQTNNVNLDGTSGTHEFQSGGQAFYSLTVDESGGTWELHDDLDIDDAYTQSNGTVDGKTYSIWADDWDQTAGTFTNSSSTLTIDSADAETINTEDPVYDLQIEDTTEDGLVGYWKFDEGQGTTAADSSGSGNDGTLTNEPLWKTHPTPPELVGYWKFDEGEDDSCSGGEDACDSSGYGNHGTSSGWDSDEWTATTATVNFTNPYALDFDGSNDFLSDITLSSSYTTYSVAMWARPGTVGIGEAVWSDAADTNYFMQIGGSNVWQFNSAFGDTASASQWDHLVGVQDGSTQYLYVNGSLVDTASGSSTLSDFDIGRRGDGLYFDGIIDDVRVYGGALSADTVEEIYAGTRANFDMSTFVNPGYLEFDGTDDYVSVGDVLDDSHIMSWGAWVYFDDSGDATPIFKRIGATEYAQLALTVASGNLYCLQGSAWETLISTSIPSTGIWHHIMCTNNGDEASMYLNGVEVGTADTSPLTSMPASTEALNFGFGRVNSTNAYHDGKIDDVRIYDYALSAVEIEALYEGNYASSNSSTITDGNLVGYWKLDEGSGTNAQDSSLNNNHGTLENMEEEDWSTTTATIDLDNPYSLELDGGDDEQVSISNDYNFDVDNQVTMAAWVRHDSTTGWQYYLGQDTADWTSDNSAFALYKLTNTSPGCSRTSNKFSFVLPYGTSCNMAFADSTTSASTNTWYHIAGTYDGSNIRIFVNGIEEDSTSYTGGIATQTGDLLIGAGYWGDTSRESIDGRIDDVRLYNRALSAGEIAALAAGGTGEATITINTALDVDNDLHIQSGELDVSATDYAVTVAGDWNNHDLFDPQEGTVTLDGTDQDVNGETTFYNFIKTESADDSDDDLLVFAADLVYSVLNTLSLSSIDSDDTLTLSSSSDGTAFVLNPTGGQQAVHRIDVQDSAASTNNITCIKCTNSGGNDDAESSPFWIFSDRSRVKNILIGD